MAKTALTLISLILLGAATLYVLACGYMFLAQRRFLYKPEIGDLRNPASAGLAEASHARVAGQDETEISAWYVAPKIHMPVIYYLHGNAGNLTGRKDRFAAFARRGYGVFAISYRGYGDSDGAPKESGLFSDAEAGRQYLAKTLGIRESDIILYGESLGTGVALHLVAEGRFRPLFVALEAPYLSVGKIARRSYPWLPVDMLLRDRFDSEKRVPSLDVPLMVLHGEADALIPPSDGRALFDKAGARVKEFYSLPGIGHVDAPPEKIIGLMERFMREKLYVIP